MTIAIVIIVLWFITLNLIHNNRDELSEWISDCITNGIRNADEGE